MLKILFSSLISISVLSFLFTQQPILKVDELTVDDLELNDTHFSNQKVVSASRSLQNLEDLPFTIYIITKEEIHEKGYNTLVDALKWIPGIRVSQPGSGLEGETFLMRGLQGNTYAKILINGIPVKPYAARGMPIGAQLPVREAERIEVIFGPAAAVYGADASAGIINIVTRESERPLYTQAEISLGAEGFSSLHVLFGGKLGKGKRILKYKVFGNFTAFRDRRIFGDTSLLFNPVNYDPNLTFNNNPNYNPNLFSQTPHDSRMIGLEFNFKKLSFSFIGMNRRDHASLGLNPTAVSYSNPNNFIQDRINSFRLSWAPEWERWGIRLNVGGLLYNRNGISSNTYVENNLKNLFDRVIREVSSTPELVKEREEEVFQRYFSGSRYSYADSFEPELEFLTFLKPISQLEFLIGSRLNFSIASSEDYLSRPLVAANAFDVTNELSFLGISLFGQAYLNFKKLKGTLSLNYSFSEIYSSRFNPRIALLFPITKDISLRTFYGTSFRVPSAFYYTNTYNVWLDDYNRFYAGDAFPLLNNVVSELQPEENSTYEIGIRWTKWENLYIDVNYYYSKTDNAITFQELIPRRDNFQTQTSDTTAFFTTGYVNFGDAYSKVHGVQASMILKIPTKNRAFNARLGLNFSEGERKLPGILDFRIGSTLEQPSFSGQLQLSIPFGKKWMLYLDNLYHAESTSELATLQARNTGEFDASTLTIPGYFTTDVILRYLINRQFQVYLQYINFFDREYGGLSATGTSDDLFYNAQSARIWRMGLSYRIE